MVVPWNSRSAVKALTCWIECSDSFREFFEADNENRVVIHVTTHGFVQYAKLGSIG